MAAGVLTGLSKLTVLFATGGIFFVTGGYPDIVAKIIVSTGN